MRDDEVPQDGVKTFDGHYKVVYARDAAGRYKTVESSGWVVEDTATRLAVDRFEEALVDARARCVAGESAPLEYHMCAHRMDVETLSDATGLPRWRVRRHLKPHVFAGLRPRLLQRYAEALQLSPADLQHLPATEENA